MAEKSGKRNFRGQAIQTQAFKLIEKVEAFFLKERDNGGPFIPVTQVKKRLSEAVGISERGLHRLSLRYKATPVEERSTPGKKHKAPSPVTDLDDFSMSKIRQVSCIYLCNLIHCGHYDLSHLELYIVVPGIT